MNGKKTLTIIDTFGFFFRLYYAMPNLKNKEGKPSGMISGFANFIMNLREEFPSDYIIFALDSKGKTLRHEMAGEYKANRDEPPAPLKEQLPVCIEMIRQMGLCAMSKEGYEADDIIATAVKTAKEQDIFVRIVTHDKDLYQLIEDGKVSIYSPQSKIDHDSASCLEKYGVLPSQIRDFLALTGDSSDNIPGVKGIGAKGAKKLLDEFGNLENIYENLSFIRNDRTRQMLVDDRENAFLSKRLTSLFYDAVEIKSFQAALFPTQNPLLKIADLLREYDLNRILKSLQNSEENAEFKLGFNAHLLTDESEIERLLEGITDETMVAFDTETTGIDANNAKIVGFSFCFNDTDSYYVPIAHSYLGVSKQVSLKFAAWAVGQIYKGCVIGQNLKYDFKVVKQNLNLNPPKNFKDTMIMAWLMEPSQAVGMDALAKRLYNYDTIKFEDVVKRGETFASVSLENAAKYASEDAWITLKFYKSFLNLLDPNLLKLANEHEFPFLITLFDMENRGIKLNRQKMQNLIIQNDATIKRLTAEIYELSGESFNINSVKQLGEVLFERLNLPAKKKTKTGYSTDEAVLTELLEAHPVIAKLLEYREIYKLQSTYCEPLLNLAKNDENSRIYTNFMQTGTSTGRLSSKNPNLQNIPARGSLAYEVRETFEAKDGFSLVGLDYSQIELRLLAHFSKDSALLEAFANDEDIHARTAISIFGESNAQNRAVAKSINFGLIYGMGSSKLSGQVGISRAEAKEYIERYFRAFPSIKGFLESIKTEAKNNGFVTTLLGRKRFFDFSTATPMQLAMYEREAVNTIFQGSAADIIKLAMVKIGKILDERASMLLQIHDELIFEVEDGFAQEFGEQAKEVMQSIYKLNVPLKTSLNIAKNWGDLK
ncbi:DNA polymerase I [Campylobacter sp. RM16187]|uniref:DNA polymerase I n=1 Tax=Campylobacter sp. RM16187 TaxID=1660063 RepID=UPI0021B4DBE6|nr:DNA polymerase I [Campylobacter sp. RM16187]QKG28616.1 DNA polymerase I, 5' --> 3' polymerase, 5' --> 3' and 3' --> 5' exonuclease [Campylobacter sp. RM16187]